MIRTIGRAVSCGWFQSKVISQRVAHQTRLSKIIQHSFPLLQNGSFQRRCFTRIPFASQKVERSLDPLFPEKNRSITDWGKAVGSTNPVFFDARFNSPIDSLMKKHLGKKLFSSNIAKVYFYGRPFILIAADSSHAQRFQSLTASLVEKVVHCENEEMALFLERYPSGHIKRYFAHPDQQFTKEQCLWERVEGPLFGVEDEELLMVRELLANFACVRAARPFHSIAEYQLDFFTSLLTSPCYQIVWQELKNRGLESLMRSILEIDSAWEKGSEGFQMIENSEFYRNCEKSEELFFELLMTRLLSTNWNNSSLSADDTKIIREALLFPSSRSRISASNLIFEKREIAMAKNITTTLQSFPQETIATFVVRCNHMQSLIPRFLQKSLL